MSLEAFLAEGKTNESTGGSGGFPIIARAKVSLAYRGGIGGTSMFFPYKYSDAQEKAKAQAECQAYMTEIGEDKWPKGDLKWPTIGVLTEAWGADVPTSENSQRWGGKIWQDFIEAYANDKTFAKMAETLPSDIKRSVTGSMPYTVIMKSLANTSSDLLDMPTWCKMFQEIDQWEELKVKLGKRKVNTYQEKEIPYRFLLIKSVYVNEKEAKADAEVIKAGQATAQPQAANDQLSAKAVENGWTLQGLRTKKAAIKNAVDNAINGIGSAEMGEVEAQMRVAEDLISKKR